MYLDATCLLYKGKTRVHTADFRHTTLGGRSDAVRHSGDVMHAGGGTHTNHLDLDALDPAITSLLFFISSWNNAKLSDITKASIAFTNADAGDEAMSI